MAKFSVGDKITIIRDDCYDDVCIGDVGVIDAINNGWSKQFRICIEGKINRHASSGLYYFTWYDFEKQKINNKIGVNKMKNKQLLKGYKKAAVRFETSNGYNDVWYAMYDDVADINDAVLCMTGHHGEVIGIVKAIEPFENDNINVDYGCEIICKIDYSAYHDRQKKLERIAKLKTTMAKKKAELDELAVYELLAKQSPEVAVMLKELKELL